MRQFTPYIVTIIITIFCFLAASCTGSINDRQSTIDHGFLQTDDNPTENLPMSLEI